jgi:hypothetical protein
MLKKGNIALYLILSVFTFGIYSFIFWYKWTEKVNTVCDGDDKDSANYILVLILSIMTFGIYTLVWNYQMGERMYQKAVKTGVQIKHGGMFITSGIINTWEERVLEAFSGNDEFEVVDVAHQGEWVAITARRK